MAEQITVETFIKAPIEKIWQYWTEPKHITGWYNASEDWHAPRANNDLKIGGKFNIRMEAKDGSFGFDFEGKYLNITDNELIEYTMEDGRYVKTQFMKENEGYKVTQTFDPENMNSVEMQKAGWQSILDNFAKYVNEK